MRNTLRNINMNVKLRYVELEPDRIFNWLNPMNITCWNAYPEWHDTWWYSETVEKRVLFGKIWTEEFDKTTGHFSKLEESILKDGIHHPINTASGRLRDVLLKKEVDSPIVFPPKCYENINDTIYTHTFGGSRLTVAQKHNIKVPCVVHDFSNLFTNEHQVTIKNYKEIFNDNYRFVHSTPYVRLSKHSHIPDGKYNGMTGDTKAAQRTATENAKGKMNV